MAARLLLLAAATVLLRSALGASFCEEQQSPPSYHVDVFEEVLSNHSDVADTLLLAPYIRGQYPDAPAYEFSGSGFHISATGLSNSIIRSSCATNEMTMYASVFFKDSHSAGPLLQISYADDSTTRLPIYGLYIDAESDEVVVAYRHAGRPHQETIPVRLTGGKWRRFAVSLSGNVLTLYVNCKESATRIVPLPDYCANDSNSLIVTVADSADREHDSEYSLRLYAYLQSVGFQFGHNGLLRQCTESPAVCPTCGQFLSLAAKAYSLQAELGDLQYLVDRLQTNGPTEVPTQSPTFTGRSCLVEQRSVTDGSFQYTTDGRVCYCRDGHPSCLTLPTDCDTTNIINGNGSEITPTPTPVEHIPGASCTLPDGRMIEVEGHEFKSRDDNQCRVFECTIVEGLLDPIISASNMECNDSLRSCSLDFNEFDQGMAKCCNFCTVCNFVQCAENSTCFVDGVDSYSCRCNPGYESRPGGGCVDRDECALGRQQGGDECLENSQCVNTPGGFECVCDVGFTGSGSRCVDIDECLGDHGCPQNSICRDSEGSFSCICNNGYEMEDGECRPICNPPCQNGGYCYLPTMCRCPRGYDGESCENDINECETGGHNCAHERSECINTIGGFFCRCQPGWQGNGTHCDDVDECSTKIHNCINAATCVNTFGTFLCVCKDNKDCTGACVRKGRIIMNGEWAFDGDRGCRNCTCIDGELSCRHRECNCNVNDPTINRTCCPQCFRRDCLLDHNDETIKIRPGSTWINPDNRCMRCSCLNIPEAECVDLSSTCPPLDCPEQYQYVPNGKCCPVCLLPSCDEDSDGDTVTFRNGCVSCTCQNPQWDCTDTVDCPGTSESCESTSILFYQDKCCPVCEQDAFGSQTCSVAS